MVAWALFDRAKASDPPRGLDATRLGKMADTSLRIAAQLEPANVEFRLMVGRFLIASGSAMSRQAAGGFFEGALAAARKAGPPQLLAASALESGKVSWRRYDAFANRRMVTSIGDIGRSLSEAMQPVAKVAAVLDELIQRDRADNALAAIAGRSSIGAFGLSSASTTDQFQKAGISQADLANAMAGGPDVAISAVSMLPLKAVSELIQAHTFALPASVAGGSDFARADTLFREAYAADPALVPAFRCAAMALAEKNRWRDLETFARTHVERRSMDGLAWLALGLAMQRQGNTMRASLVFDTAMTVLAPDERVRLESLARIVSSDRVRPVSPERITARDLIANYYWMSSDPLWSDGMGESRTELRARVAFAELRWTVEEAGIHGADTDRGDVYVRYGPPDLAAVIGPNMVENAADVLTFWMYRSGLMFAFSGLTGFGTSRIPLADRAMVDAMKDAQPVRWDNMSAPQPDSMTVVTARFRATPVAHDVYVAVAPPVDAIRRTATSGRVRADLWFLTGRSEVAYRDSIAADSAGPRSWIARVDGGEYLVRVEATGTGTKRSARGSAIVDVGPAFPSIGPGVSDLLIAASARPRESLADRWSDLIIVPAFGSVGRGGEFSLVWENYEFGAREGTAQYEVAVTISRQRSALGAIVARVVGALAAAARVEAGVDRMVIRYDRRTGHSPVIADNMGIALGATPPGLYLVTIDVTDRVSGSTYSRSTPLVVRD
jgi:GWxTD domain-containing protein